MKAFLSGVLGVLAMATIGLTGAFGEDSRQVDLAVPDSPAFKVLGVSPQKIDRPGTPRQLAASLINGIDSNGNFQSGVAIDASLLRFAAKTTLQQYTSNYRTRFVDRTNFSFATAKGASETDKSLKMAVGLKLTPWDEADPRLDGWLTSCLQKAVDTETINNDPNLAVIDMNILQERRRMIGKDDPVLKKEVDDNVKTLNAAKNKKIAELSAAGIKACRAKAPSNLWNKSAWSVAVAPTFLTQTGNNEDMEYAGLGAWTSVSYGIGSNAQLIGQVMYRNNEEVPVPNASNTFFKRDTLNFGGQLRFGRENLNGNIELLYAINNNENGVADDNVFKYAAGMEFRATKDFWIALSIGTETGNESGNKLFALSNLKWAFESEPSMAPK